MVSRAPLPKPPPLPTRRRATPSEPLLRLPTPPTSLYEANSQLKLLLQSNLLLDARRLFDQMPHRDEISYTTLISGYLRLFNPSESLRLFSQLHSNPPPFPDQFTLSLALKASAASSPSHLPFGQSIHSLSLKSGALPSSVFVATALLDLYSRSSPSPSLALRVFSEIPIGHCNVVSWTAAITALVRAGRCHDAVRWFAEMRASNIPPCDSHTFAIVFKACTDANLLSRGKEVLSHAVKIGHDTASFVANTVATMYSKCGDSDLAVVLFERMRQQDVVSWTSVISTYVQMGREKKAVDGFVRMLGNQSDVSPNEYTYSAVISACVGLANASWGEQLHAHVTRRGFTGAMTVANALVTLYSRIGCLASADTMFNEMSLKDVVSWSAIISAYAQEGHAEESFALFDKMRSSGIRPNEYPLASLLSACASTALWEAGRQVHALVTSVGLESDAMITSALINMYSKCGTIDEARRIFDDVKPNNVVSWTAMINGYAEHGLSKEAIELFDRMGEVGLLPDHVAYIGVLMACSHAGLVDLGMKYFELMRRECRMEPWKEHYGCMVDLLGRAGRLKEAEAMIEEMPWKADEVVWTALLRACGVHGDTELGRRAAAKVLELEPECAGAHIALSNIYAAKGRWREASEMRRAMRGKGVRKEAGWSWIGVVDGGVEVFTAADRSHERWEKIYGMLDMVYFGVKMEGFELDTNSMEFGDEC